MKKIGIYVHIPFCAKKCDYCDFVSYSNQAKNIAPYMEMLKNEIRDELQNKEYQVETIYIGGGTPSFVDSKHITEILKTIQTSAETGFSKKSLEITIEVNPGTITKQKLLDYKNAGINRLSIGLQETHNALLQEIGRIHTYEQFLETYQLAREVRFQNINVDLMIGLPNQTIEHIKESLEKITNLNPEHLSVYSLILEEGTKLYERIQNNELTLPSENLERNMYWYVKNTLENKGYTHYEISNFAKEGYESKHNLNCWNQEEYIGFGLSAHSYLNGTRYSNESEPKGSDPFGSLHKIIHETQTEHDMEKEYMLLGLRKIEGVSIQAFKNKFGDNPIFVFYKELNGLVEKELLEIDGDFIRLTNKGLDLANLVWQEFV